MKLSVIDGEQTLSEESVAAGAATDLLPALLDGVDAAVLRVVHGGPAFRRATRVDGDVRRQLQELSWLAPLHNPPALDLIDRVLELRPGLPVVACFDTTFHATLPESAYTYPVPRSWTVRWGLRRFGFHGLSHEYASRRAGAMLGRVPGRLITCHLGAGASLCAIQDGRSVDTTMGFTPMEGLMMATRSGSIDPGLVLFALRRGLSVDEIEHGLDRESGILGVSGISSDFGEVVAAAGAGDLSAGLALGVYQHRLVQGIAAMAASLGGIDALLFTGGVGEHQAALRQETCAALGFLGVVLHAADAEAAGLPDQLLGVDGAVDVLVVHAREDLEMARQATSLLSGTA